MDCPFCGKELRQGMIATGYQLSWRSCDEIGEERECVPLAGLFGGELEAFFCPDCRRIVLPVPEKAGFLEAARQKRDAAGEKIGAAREQWETRRAEEKERRTRKEFGSKDPWEL